MTNIQMSPAWRNFHRVGNFVRLPRFCSLNHPELPQSHYTSNSPPLFCLLYQHTILWGLGYEGGTVALYNTNPLFSLIPFTPNYSEGICTLRTIIGFLILQISCHLKSNLKPFSHGHTKTSSPTVFNNTSQSPSMTSEDIDGPGYYPMPYAALLCIHVCFQMFHFP